MMVFSPVQYLNLNIPLDFPGPFPVYRDKVPACVRAKEMDYTGKDNTIELTNTDHGTPTCRVQKRSQ